MKDKYDLAIEYLTEHPGMIYQAWIAPLKYWDQGGCLFQFVSRKQSADERPEGAGCLTMIRRRSDAFPWKAFNANDEYDPALTEMILQDERLSTHMSSLQPKDLQVFAEWQRRLDILIRGVEPPVEVPEPQEQTA